MRFVQLPMYAFLTGLFLLAPALSGCATGTRPDGVSASDRPVKITGCYSNMYFNEEGGDLLGFELFVVPTRDGYHVLYQHSEGEPDAPLLVPATVEGDTIRFTVSHDGPFPGQFRGTVTEHELTGRFERINEEIVLERKASYWQ